MSDDSSTDPIKPATDEEIATWLRHRYRYSKEDERIVARINAEKARADAAEWRAAGLAEADRQAAKRIAELEAELADIRKHLIKPLRRGMEIWEELNTQGHIKWWPDIQQMTCSKDWKNVNYWLEEHTDD